VLDIVFNLHEAAIDRNPWLSISCWQGSRTGHATSSKFASYKLEIAESSFGDVRAVHPDNVAKVPILYKYVEIRGAAQIDDAAHADRPITVANRFEQLWR
jgi:hypothetical protein